MSEEMKMPLVEALVFCDKNPEYELSNPRGSKYYLIDEWLSEYGNMSIKYSLHISKDFRTVRKRHSESHREVKQVLEKYLRPPCKIDEAFELLKPYLKGE